MRTTKFTYIDTVEVIYSRGLVIGIIPSMRVQ